MPTRTAKIEYKDIPASEMRATNDRQGIIEGLVSKTGNVDLQDDRVLPGAWRDTLKSAYARKAAGDPYLVPFLWSHNFDVLPPGGVFYLDETREGLFAKVQMNLDVQSGAELYASYRAGTVSKQSIGYKTITCDYEKIEGKTIRNLRVCELMECSAVLFPANTLAAVTAVKGGYPMNKLAVRGKDFSERYAQQQLSDWLYDDLNDVTTALGQALRDCFSSGADPLAALETDVLPGLEAALRAYVQAGIDLGYTGSSTSDYGMMGMASSTSGESKAGYLNATSHARIKEASTMIMKHAKIVASELSALESRNARARAGQLAGWPVYGSMSEPSIFEEKEAIEDMNLQLKLINTRLEVDAALREGREQLAETVPSPTAGVEAALARLIESKRR